MSPYGHIPRADISLWPILKFLSLDISLTTGLHLVSLSRILGSTVPLPAALQSMRGGSFLSTSLQNPESEKAPLEAGRPPPRSAFSEVKSFRAHRLPHTRRRGRGADRPAEPGSLALRGPQTDPERRGFALPSKLAPSGPAATPVGAGVLRSGARACQDS